MQTVSELDDQNADVARHRHDHFSNGLGLCRVAKFHFIELGNPIDEHCDFIAKIRSQ